jgi:uncharacterized protein
MPAPSLRALASGDERMMQAFFAGRPDTTMFLRSNLERAGIAYEGAPLEGLYVGAFDHDRLVGVAAHYGNGNVVLGASDHAASLARFVAEQSGRSVSGLVGPWAEVTAARAALRIDPEAIRYESREILYALDLDDLVVPEGLSAGRLSVRRPSEPELSPLLAWRMEYCAETMGTPDNEATRASQKQSLAVLQDEGRHYVLVAGGERAAYSAFNATAADAVQVGGVFTPVPLRGRGHGRAVVAGSLQDARSRGARRAVLFTPEDNTAAQRCYVSIGFREAGDYGLVFLT